MIVARTLKGKGVSFAEGKDGWHGKAFKKGEETRPRHCRARSAVRARAGRRRSRRADSEAGPSRPAAPPAAQADRAARLQGWASRWRRAKPTAPRSPSWARRIARVVALDADVKNSTFSDKFEKALPDRFYQNFIAEQVDDRLGDGSGGARRDSVSVDLRVLPRARRRLHPHGGHQQRRHQDGRLARRRLDRRGRAVADGARGSRDVPGAAEHHGAVSVRRASAPSGSWRWPRIIRARSTSARAGRRRR